MRNSLLLGFGGAFIGAPRRRARYRAALLVAAVIVVTGGGTSGCASRASAPEPTTPPPLPPAEERVREGSPGRSSRRHLRPWARSPLHAPRLRRPPRALRCPGPRRRARATPKAPEATTSTLSKASSSARCRSPRRIARRRRASATRSAICRSASAISRGGARSPTSWTAAGTVAPAASARRRASAPRAPSERARRRFHDEPTTLLVTSGAPPAAVCLRHGGLRAAELPSLQLRHSLSRNDGVRRGIGLLGGVPAPRSSLRDCSPRYSLALGAVDRLDQSVSSITVRVFWGDPDGRQGASETHPTEPLGTRAKTQKSYRNIQ